MHRNANTLMNQKTSVYEFAKRVLQEQDPEVGEAEIEAYVRNKDRVWISMFDMALIQWSFLGPAMLEPVAAGFHGISRQGLEDLIYTWKVFSYKLGINANYSILEDGNYETVYALCKLILEQEYILHMVLNADRLESQSQMSFAPASS